MSEAFGLRLQDIDLTSGRETFVVRKRKTSAGVRTDLDNRGGSPYKDGPWESHGQWGVDFLVKRLTGRRAAWLGLLSTPVLVIAAVLVAGVATGSAGPTTVAAPAAPQKSGQAANGVVSHQVTQSLAEVKAYWTADRLSAATPMPLLEKSVAGNAPSPQQAPALDTMGLAMMRADGTVDFPADIRHRAAGPCSRPRPTTRTFRSAAGSGSAPTVATR